MKSKLNTKTSCQAGWRIVYTKPRYEKKVHKELTRKGVESFLPLQKRLHQWSDRKKWVELPLFFNYVFVNIKIQEQFDVLNTTGVVNFIKFENEIAKVPSSQIDTIKRFLEYPDEIEVTEYHPQLEDEVEIIRGSLMGIKGELVSVRGKKKVAVLIKQLNKTLLIEVATSNLRKHN